MGELTRAKFDASELTTFVNIELLRSRHSASIAGAQWAAAIVLEDIQRVTRSVD